MTFPAWLRRLLGLRGEWRAPGQPPEWEAEAQRIIRRVEQLSGDGRGLLEDGGVVVVLQGLDHLVDRATVRHVSGTCEAGRIWVLPSASPRDTALAHEAAHLGLRRREWWPWGPVRLPTEEECNAVAEWALSDL